MADSARGQTARRLVGPDPEAGEGDAAVGRRPRGRKPRPPGDAGDPVAASSAAVILDAALRLIASRNYGSVTVKDIAAAADVNVALIYYYYASKENLFLSILNAMLGQAAERFRGLTAEGISPDRALALWAEVHADEFDNVQRFLKMCLDYASSLDRTAVVDRVISGYYEHEETILRSIIQAGVIAGVFRRVDVHQVVRLASALIDGILVREVITPTGLHRRDIAAAYAMLLSHLAVEPDEA
ncbi:TetR/AcrR family transcriptional regulator [Chthonobacter rhizosphaerae]|uniref:TetR/AcrR family transcriptional regulator n=1 Tax=Chthonobacter rhizosphaerae TaxID=2735553 RepID=UPI0015EE91CD|nr:TetR family transcriptional regulator [Chthonobacter rhizosphaerae]